MVQVPEPVISASKAQADGKALAQKYAEDKSGDPLHDFAAQLAAHRDDPDFCSAFYANLPAGVAVKIPSLLKAAHDPTMAADLKTYSEAFGTAVSGAFPAPGFDTVVSYAPRPCPRVTTARPGTGAAMLQYGTFPTDFPDQDHPGRRSRPVPPRTRTRTSAETRSVQALGLPQDIVTLDLQALSANEAATQQALAGMVRTPARPTWPATSSPWPPTPATQHDPQLTAAFQATLLAGSGDRSTQGPYGSYYAPIVHTGAESTFATAAMSALSGSHAKQSDYQDFITTTFTTFGQPADATPQQAGHPGRDAAPADRELRPEVARDPPRDPVRRRPGRSGQERHRLHEGLLRQRRRRPHIEPGSRTPRHGRHPRRHRSQRGLDEDPRRVRRQPGLGDQPQRSREAPGVRRQDVHRAPRHVGGEHARQVRPHR